ncbi:MAG: hypothetical protein ACLP50_21890 [Solirubrobacteraceae bacterium]
MGSANTQEAIYGLALELLSTGDMVAGPAVELVETLPAEAYPAEKPAALVVEMLTGSICTALVEAGQSDAQRAVELMREAADRVIEHLGLGLSLRRRMEGADGTRRGHG